MLSQMSMIVHVRWVGGLFNVHMDKIYDKTTIEETRLQKSSNLLQVVIDNFFSVARAPRKYEFIVSRLLSSRFLIPI